jgi:hypothetical protein
MTHALADVVLVERFWTGPGEYGEMALGCPACPWQADITAFDLGDMLTAARRHILEDHPGGDPLSHEHAYTAALHAVDASQGDPYPALIPEAYMPVERPGKLSDVNRCEACGRTVRGPLLPILTGDAIRMVGPGCARRHADDRRRPDDLLPLPPEGGDHA